MSFFNNFFVFNRSESPHSKNNGTDKTQSSIQISSKNEMKNSIGKDSKTNLNSSLKKENPISSNEKSNLIEENKKLKEENKNLIHILMSTEKEYQKKYDESQKYIKELENKVRYYETLSKEDLSTMNGTIQNLINENTEMKKELQNRCRLMEINLEREYKCAIWKELEKTPGILYNIRNMDSRKTELFLIDNNKIKLEDVVVPKAVFVNGEMIIESRKLTEDEIQELNNGNEVLLYNSGSKLTSISSYDVIIKIPDENDLRNATTVMKKIEVKKNERKEKKIEKKGDIQKNVEKKEVNEKQTIHQQNQVNNQMNNQQMNQMNQQNQMSQQTSSQHNQINQMNYQQQNQMNQINNQMKQQQMNYQQQNQINNQQIQQPKINPEPIYEQQEIYISIKDAYYGVNQFPIKIFGQNWTINFNAGIRDGKQYTFEYGMNSNGQKMYSTITFRYDKTKYPNYQRQDNNLIASFEYPKQYTGQFTNISIFDQQLQQQIQLVDGSYSISQAGFKGDDGNYGDFYFFIKMV